MTTTYCVEYASLFRQKMHDRFRILTVKRPLPEGSEAKEIFLVPTDAAQNPIIGPDLSEPSAYLPFDPPSQVVNWVKSARILR